jgi:hypothetical protein
MVVVLFLTLSVVMELYSSKHVWGSVLPFLTTFVIQNKTRIQQCKMHVDKKEPINKLITNQTFFIKAFLLHILALKPEEKQVS